MPECRDLSYLLNDGMRVRYIVLSDANIHDNP